MKKKINHVALLCLISTTSLLSCQKESTNQLPESGERPANLVNYLSATLNIATNNIQFDPKSQEFYFTDNSLRFKLSEIEKRYEGANIYRSQIKNGQ